MNVLGSNNMTKISYFIPSIFMLIEHNMLKTSYSCNCHIDTVYVHSIYNKPSYGISCTPNNYSISVKTRIHASLYQVVNCMLI